MRSRGYIQSLSLFKEFFVSFFQNQKLESVGCLSGLTPTQPTKGDSAWHLKHPFLVENRTDVGRENMMKSLSFSCVCSAMKAFGFFFASENEDVDVVEAGNCAELFACFVVIYCSLLSICLTHRVSSNAVRVFGRAASASKAAQWSRIHTLSSWSSPLLPFPLPPPHLQPCCQTIAPFPVNQMTRGDYVTRAAMTLMCARVAHVPSFVI